MSAKKSLSKEQIASLPEEKELPIFSLYTAEQEKKMTAPKTLPVPQHPGKISRLTVGLAIGFAFSAVLAIYQTVDKQSSCHISQNPDATKPSSAVVNKTTKNYTPPQIGPTQVQSTPSQKPIVAVPPQVKAPVTPAPTNSILIGPPKPTLLEQKEPAKQPKPSETVQVSAPLVAKSTPQPTVAVNKPSTPPSPQKNNPVAPVAVKPSEPAPQNTLVEPTRPKEPPAKTTPTPSGEGWLNEDAF